MNRILVFHLFVCLVATSACAEFQMDWAYHSAGNASRLTEQVPETDIPFLASGSGTVRDADSVTLYLLTDQNFAEDLTEQVFVRWWDGTMSHWIMGSWVKNVTLDASSADTCLRGLPKEGTQILDLWKVVIPASITRPGENFYAIQLKGYGNGESEERYLLRKLGGDFSQTNPLGQIWSASEEFDGQDWKIQVQP